MAIWFQNSLKLDGTDSIDFKLKNHDEFRLYIFAPIVDDKAVSGLQDKYMAIATFEKSENGKIKAFEDGKILTFNADELETI